MLTPDPIGGYHGLELRAGIERHAGALRFQSARAAFLALLQCHHPRRVWVPSYLCKSMVEPLEAERIETLRYAVDDRLAPPENLSLRSGDLVLYVNYFGLCEQHVDDLLTRLPHEVVVIDNAQAFFSRPRDCLASIYSPRKFFGVADGGYLYTSLPVAPPVEADTDSAARSAHLLVRAAQGPEAGYSAYQAAERSLEHQVPRAMSALTRSILASVDYDQVARIRRTNFSHLASELGAHNRLQLPLEPEAVPLAYPYIVGASSGLRERLRAARIFVPTYWPELLGNPTQDEAAAELGRRLLPLPCDQRYGAAHMSRIVSVIKGGES